MSESPNLESFFGIPNGKEKTTESDEKFSERYHQSQAAAKKVKQEESKKKKKDNSLAKIIATFLNQKGRSGYFLLISRLVAANLPSDFLLSILSPIFPQAAEKILQNLEQLPPGDYQKMTDKKSDLSPEIKLFLNSWTNDIFRIAASSAEKILQNGRDSEKKPIFGITELFAIVLQEYLEEKNVSSQELQNFQNLRIISGGIFENMFIKLEKIAPEKKLIS